MFFAITDVIAKKMIFAFRFNQQQQHNVDEGDAKILWTQGGISIICSVLSEEMI